MCWLMCMTNGLLVFRFVTGTLNSDKYIQLLSEIVVTISRINYGTNFYFQEDNFRVYKSKKVKKFMADFGIQVIKWPSRGPDLNIWKMISSQVYNGPQFDNHQQLMNKVVTTINDINVNLRD